MTHPIDPPHLYKSIPTFGRLVARGLMDFGECMDALMCAAVKAGVADLTGIEMRLMRALVEAATKREMAATAEVRRILAAHAANVRHGAILPVAQVDAMALEAANRPDGVRRAG